MLVVMAGTDIFDMGQLLSYYLFAYVLPQIILLLTFDACQAVASFPVTDPPWPLQGKHRPRLQKRVKRVIKPQVTKSSDDKNHKMSWGWTYLFPWDELTYSLLASPSSGLVVALNFSFGNAVTAPILGRPPHPHFRAMLSNEGDQESTQYVCFDADSYPIGVDNHASRCMINAPHLFEDLVLAPQGRQVDRIASGMEIEGTGTYVMRHQDDHDRTHEIKNPNSLYLPKLRQCLLSPQH